jgi:hypothetical protein
MLTCASCGNEEQAGSSFCGSCGAPFVPADPEPASTPAEVTAPTSLDAPTEVAPPPFWHAPPSDPAPPAAAARQARPPDETVVSRHAPESDRRTVVTPPLHKRGRRGLVAVGAAALVVAAGIVTAIFVFSDKSTRHPAPRPPRHSVASQVAARLRSNLVPLQRSLDRRVRTLTSTGSSFDAMETAALAVEREVVRSEGWMSSAIRPRTDGDRAVRDALATALSAHRAYANSIANLPAGKTTLAKPTANRVISLARQADDQYIRLTGAAPAVPIMPIPQADHVHLLDFVPPPQPTTTTTPPPQPSAVQAIKTMIRAHWRAVNNGDYELAFSYFSPRLQSAVGRTNWVQDKEVDQPTSTRITFQAVSVSGTSATAYVSFSSRGQETAPGNTGCNAWNGPYSMVELSDHWYIDKSTLQRTSFTC